MREENLSNEIWGGAAKKVLATLVLGAAACLLGIMLGGCGGGGADLPDSGADALAADAGRPDAGRADVVPAGDATGPGLGRTDAGLVFCAIPSPTGDQPYHGATARSQAVPGRIGVLEGDVRAACEAEKAPGSPNMDPSNPYSYIPNLAGTDCSDVAGDFAGTTGVPWCVWAVEKDGVTHCDGMPDGSRPCLPRGISPMTTRTSEGQTYFARTWALCTPAGVFAGWLCL